MKASTRRDLRQSAIEHLRNNVTPQARNFSVDGDAVCAGAQILEVWGERSLDDIEALWGKYRGEPVNDLIVRLNDTERLSTASIAYMLEHEIWRERSPLAQALSWLGLYRSRGRLPA